MVHRYGSRSTAIDTSLLISVSITVTSRVKFDTDPTWTSSKIYPWPMVTCKLQCSTLAFMDAVSSFYALLSSHVSFHVGFLSIVRLESRVISETLLQSLSYSIEQPEITSVMNHHRLKSHSFLSPVLLCSLVVVEGCIGDQANVVHVLWQDMIELLYISLKYWLKLGDCSFYLSLDTAAKPFFHWSSALDEETFGPVCCLDCGCRGLRRPSECGPLVAQDSRGLWSLVARVKEFRMIQRT
jgi:hypothetical protein